GGKRGVPQPRLRPRHVRGAGPGARREGLPGLRRCRPARLAGERGPTGIAPPDRSEGPAGGPRAAAATRGERGPMAGVLRGVARGRDAVRIVRLDRRPRTRSGRDRAETRGNHGRPREPRAGRRFPGDARRRPERDLAGLWWRDARRPVARGVRPPDRGVADEGLRRRPRRAPPRRGSPELPRAEREAHPPPGREEYRLREISVSAV